MHGGRSTIGTVFAGSQITKFHELALFTGVKTIGGAYQPFANSTLVEFTLPAYLENLTTFSLREAASLNMDELVMPTTLVTIKEVQAKGYIGKIVVRSLLTNFTPHYMYGSSLSGSLKYTFVFDVDGVIPLSNTQYAGNHVYYVPDNLVDTYKAAANWSTVASKILPMSQLPMV